MLLLMMTVMVLVKDQRFRPIDQGGVKRSRFALCMGWTAQVNTRDQDGLADSSINYTALAYQTCGARMCCQHSALRASHSCECTAVQHDGMTGHLCAQYSRYYVNVTSALNTSIPATSVSSAPSLSILLYAKRHAVSLRDRDTLPQSPDPTDRDHVHASSSSVSSYPAYRRRCLSNHWPPHSIRCECDVLLAADSCTIDCTQSTAQAQVQQFTVRPGRSMTTPYRVINHTFMAVQKCAYYYYCYF